MILLIPAGLTAKEIRRTAVRAEAAGLYLFPLDMIHRRCVTEPRPAHGVIIAVTASVFMTAAEVMKRRDKERMNMQKFVVRIPRGVRLEELAGHSRAKTGQPLRSIVGRTRKGVGLLIMT